MKLFSGQSSLNFESQLRCPGAFPTVVSYSASAVKMYNATGSLVRFERKLIFFSIKNALDEYNDGVVHM
jgi:hypothetical protein